MPEDGDEIQIDCPVDGCDYSGPVNSVAGHVSGKKDEYHDWWTLGYEGYYEFIREQKGNQKASKSILVHMTDSHIGRKKGGHGHTSWPIDCGAGFQKAVEVAISVSADAVVHTGDLFHNDTEIGITEDHLVTCIRELAKLQDANIPFFFVLGDHENDDGERVRDELEEIGWTSSLDSTPTLIGDWIALYGIDYHPESWWNESYPRLKEPPNGRMSILALHQSIRQFVKKARAECDVREILRWSQAQFGLEFNAIVVGQHHKDVKTKVRGCEVLCGGATERISQRNFEPFVRVFKADTSGLSHRKILLDLL